MAEFSKTYPKIKKHEGGWVNDPQDPGGETYRGVTTRDWGHLTEFWNIIHAAKVDGKFQISRVPQADRAVLDREAEFVCRWGYWRPLHGDEMPNQSIAGYLCDTGYLYHWIHAAKFLQRSLNALNRVGTLYPNMLVDGWVGTETIKAFQACMAAGRGRQLFALIRSCRHARTMKLMAAAEYREKYLGWITRAEDWEYVED